MGHSPGEIRDDGHQGSSRQLDLNRLSDCRFFPHEIRCYTRPVTPETLVPVSVEDFWHLAHRQPRSELVAGQVIPLTPSGLRHGAIVMTVARAIDDHVIRHGLGLVLGAETGFILSHDPPTVRAADVSVILKARVPHPLSAGFFPGAPDLAVEVLSPDDRPGEMAAKVTDYLEAGSAAVWVVDPEGSNITVHTRKVAMKYGADEVIDGGHILPGFHTQVGALLAERA